MRVLSTLFLATGALAAAVAPHDDRLPRVTPAPDLGETVLFDNMNIFPRTAYSGEACFTTQTISTTHCDLETVGDRVRTATCYSTMAPSSRCASGKTCSMDRQGNDICMDLINNPGIPGIIVTIVFSCGIVGGIAAITFLCCKDRKEQKRLTAKAEATALARAATKKKRNAERGPLMGQQRNVSANAGDPFHDSNRS